MTTEAEAFVDRMVIRSEAATLLGLNDTEFALRLIWDADFPKALDSGLYRLADILAWKDAHVLGS